MFFVLYPPILMGYYRFFIGIIIYTPLFSKLADIKKGLTLLPALCFKIIEIKPSSGYPKQMP
jgi:hypothetical protein